MIESPIISHVGISDEPTQKYDIEDQGFHHGTYTPDGPDSLWIAEYLAEEGGFQEYGLHEQDLNPSH